MSERPDRRRVGPAAAVALVVGVGLALALVVTFTWYDDPCPGYDDEGGMAAPGSAYARVMCEPAVTLLDDTMSQIELPPVTLLAPGLGLLLAGVLVWRRPRIATRRRVAVGLVAVLLTPPAVVLLAQVALPRDCLSGRTDAGDCGRDRELR